MMKFLLFFLGCTLIYLKSSGQGGPKLAVSSLKEASNSSETDGSATVTATGGKGGYKYSWSTHPVQTKATATGMAAGTYTCTVTDAAGQAQTTTVIIDVEGLDATGTSSKASSNTATDGTATIVATGGTLPYAYAWSTTPIQKTPTATGLFAGQYTCTVTDAIGAKKSADVGVLASLSATDSVTNLTSTGGNDGTVIANPSGGTTPYTYSWNSTPIQTTQKATGLPPGQYTCTVKDATGATFITPAATVAGPPAALTATIASTDVTGNGMANGTVTVTPAGGTPVYKYQWVNTDTKQPAPTQGSQTVNNFKAGTYYCVITDRLKSSFTTSDVIIKEPLGLGAVKGYGPNFKKGNDGRIEIPIIGSIDTTVDYTIAFINGNEHDSVVVHPFNNSFYILKRTAGIYKNIVILCGKSNVAPTPVPDSVILTVNTLSGNLAVQTADINAAAFYNYSGVSNDFPTGYVQYYLSGSCPINAPDGIPQNADFCDRIIWFRNLFGTFSYTDPSAFDLRTVDRLKDRYVNQLDLFTHANVAFNPNVNILTFILPHKRRAGKAFGDDAHIYVDFNSGLLVTNVSDSLNDTTTKKYSVKSMLLGLSVAIKSTLFLNSSLQALGRVSIFTLHQNSNSVDYNLGPQYANINDTLDAQNAGRKLVTTKKSTPYFSFSGQLMYNLNGVAKNSASNIYLRYALTSDFANVKSQRYSNSFWSIQIGYILTLDKIFYPQSTTPNTTSASSIKSL